MRSHRYEVLRNRSLGGDSAVLEVCGPIPETLPGQFYMLRTVERWPVLLPRPFSLYDRAEGGGRGSFLVKAVGPGTRALAGLSQGDGLWATGPLGRPFPEDVPDPLCVAGGVGLAPFLLLARRRREAGLEPPRLLFGGRSREGLAGLEDLEGLARVSAATEDGSHGRAGLVTDLLEDLLRRGEVRAGGAVFCCGPDAMMSAVARLCARAGLRCWVSLENYMGCGYGVCNGCSVRVRAESFDGWPYSRSCVEGPVYPAEDLEWSPDG